MGVLKNYTQRNNKYIEAKNKLLSNVKKICEVREKIIKGFKDEIFPCNYGEAYEEQMRFEREEETNNIRNKNGPIDYGKLMRKIGFKERNINSGLVKKNCFTYDLGDVVKNFKKSKTNS